MRIELFRREAGSRELIWAGSTNADGRTDGPLLEGASFLPADYELHFFVGDYFASSVGPAKFLGVVPIVFSADPATGNYHVPLLCSPWSYTTYRGS